MWWNRKQGVALLRLYPVPRDRAFAVGAIKQIAMGGGALGTVGYGLSRYTSYPSYTVLTLQHHVRGVE